MNKNACMSDIKLEYIDFMYCQMLKTAISKKMNDCMMISR